MKVLTRFIYLLLALVVSVNVVACDNKTPSGGNNDGHNNNEIYNYLDTETYPDNDDGLIRFGTHQMTAPFTEDDRWLVKNGMTEYTVVVPDTTPESNTSDFRIMKEEFVYFFEKATNIPIKVKTDKELGYPVHANDQHYISIGRTSLVKSAGVDYSHETLTRLGGRVQTKGNNIYIVGATDFGALSAVYSFLQVTFNYQVYSATTYEIQKNVENAKLRLYDIIDISDTEIHSTSPYEEDAFSQFQDYQKRYEHSTYDQRMYMKRLRIPSDTGASHMGIFPGYEIDDIIADESLRTKYVVSGGHNSILMVSPNKEYAAEHPEWWSSDKLQLCYTAGGDEESFELITSELAKAFCYSLKIQPLEKYPFRNQLELTTSDDPKMCTCSGCEEGRAMGYKDSGLIIRYMNRIAEKVEEWMNLPENEPYKRPELRLAFFAYLTTEAPPVVYDADSESWQPVDDTVVMHKYVTVKYAPIASDFQQSLFAADNLWVKDLFDGWVAVANGNIGYFMYFYYVRGRNYFYDAFDYLKTKDINYHLAGGRSYYYSENFHGPVATEFGALISFVNEILCYNSTLDSGKLINRYFDNVYGPASEIMYELFVQLRAFSHKQAMKYEMYKRSSILNQIYHIYDYNAVTVAGWIDLCDQAEQAVEYMKDIDPENYDRICYNIALERFSPIVIMFINTKVKEKVSAEQKAMYKAELLESIQRWPDYGYTVVDSSANLKDWVHTL